MADITKYFPKLLKHEGGYNNDPLDHGGSTNMGVTLATWKQLGYDKNNDGVINSFDIKLLSQEDALKVLKRGYWDKWKADNITNQSIAESLVEWIWGSGVWGIKIPQRLLGIPEDGIVGIQTISAVNSADPVKFYDQLYHAKLSFIDGIIAAHPEQIKWKNGWINRINDFKFSL